MGGIEDSEPPLKRVKGVLGGSNSSKEEDLFSTEEAISCSLGDDMARPLPTSQVDGDGDGDGDGNAGDTVGSQGLIKRSEFVKIITKALYSLGYDKTGALLEEESGIPLHSSLVNLFMQQVMDGMWDQSLNTLHKIGLSDKKAVKSASFLILEQKFLELLKRDKLNSALITLRNEIAPLQINVNRVHELAACIVHPLESEEGRLCNGDSESSSSRTEFMTKLQKLLPPSIMIPEKRLEHLVERALDVQRGSCEFHNARDKDLSLYLDHHCGRNQIPSKTLQV